MCGICGIFNQDGSLVPKERLVCMIDLLKHRGPDENGFYLDSSFGMAHSRLSIIDLTSGSQPIHNERKNLHIIFNGEIFNYLELRENLLKEGHTFYTNSDTEVIIHLYEDMGVKCLELLNGQFAIAIFDDQKKELFLARDRVGIQPLFYAKLPNSFIFSSEIKAILASKMIAPEISPQGLNQIFTFWTNVPASTVFKGIKELTPAHYLIIKNHHMKRERYWNLRFSNGTHGTASPRSLEEYKARLDDLLNDAVRLRLRADVPVAAYLSGGLDSTIVTTLIKKRHQNTLKTFSVNFENEDYDEACYQKEVIDRLGVEHVSVMYKSSDIYKYFEKVIWLTERPILRAGPVPLFLLSKLVRDNNIKVVLTGEGADEFFGGYNIFKETKIRLFLSRQPKSLWRSNLFKKLYPFMSTRSRRTGEFWQSFFEKQVERVDDIFYSHRIRWESTSWVKRFFSPYINESIKNSQPTDDLEEFMREGFLFEGSMEEESAHEESMYEQSLCKGSLHNDLSKLHPFLRAQYLEIILFMSGYLLSSQGDRMLMGNSVEGRFPFLDHRVIEFANALPINLKMRALNEKYLLKETFRNSIPENVAKRNKQPFRAPGITDFTADTYAHEIMSDLLSEEYIKNYGIFDHHAVILLLKKIKQKGINAAREEMALLGILSTQLLKFIFIENASGCF
jgi:asparagine synthase (glutamine-hydrolysing)